MRFKFRLFKSIIVFISLFIITVPGLVYDHTFVNIPDKTTILSAARFSGTTSNGLSLGLIQSVTANGFAKISDQWRV